MMEKLLRRESYLLKISFYSIWSLSLLLQAYFTELTPDEAYYWKYAQHLAWGYFDYPPVIAAMIKMGFTLFSNELGVRFFSVVMMTVTLVLMESLIKPSRQILYYGIVSSILLFHFIGFLAIPDTPLFFFSFLFLMVYKNFLDRKGTAISVVLGLLAAGMILSKYHGFLILGLIILSNISLLRTSYFWLAVVTALLLISPHIWWQIQEGFPTFKYHMWERNAANYSILYTFEYLLVLLVIPGPIIGIFIYKAAIRLEPINPFERALAYLFWGFIIFFFFMTFKGRVEGHWPAFIIIPGTYMVMKYLDTITVRKKALNNLIILSICLILMIRLSAIIYKPLEFESKFNAAFKNFNNKSFIEAVYQVADTLPVGYMNSYQKASLYSFYNGQQGFTINNYVGRKNQFNIWKTDKQLRENR